MNLTRQEFDILIDVFTNAICTALRSENVQLKLKEFLTEIMAARGAEREDENPEICVSRLTNFVFHIRGW